MEQERDHPKGPRHRSIHELRPSVGDTDPRTNFDATCLRDTCRDHDRCDAIPLPIPNPNLGDLGDVLRDVTLDWETAEVDERRRRWVTPR